MEFKAGDIVELCDVSYFATANFDWNSVLGWRGKIITPGPDRSIMRFFDRLPYEDKEHPIVDKYWQTRTLRLANLEFYPGQEVLIRWKITDSPLGWIDLMDPALGKTGIIRDRGMVLGKHEYYILDLDIKEFNGVWWPPEALVAISNSNSYKNIGLNLLTKLWGDR